MFCFALNSSKLWWDNPPWNVTTVDFFVAVPAQSTCFQPAKKYNLEISRRVVPKPLSYLWLCTWMSVQYSFVLSETINFFELNWIELNLGQCHIDNHNQHCLLMAQHRYRKICKQVRVFSVVETCTENVSSDVKVWIISYKVIVICTKV